MVGVNRSRVYSEIQSMRKNLKVPYIIYMELRWYRDYSSLEKSRDFLFFRKRGNENGNL